MKVLYPLLYMGIFLILPILLFSQERSYRKYATQAVHQQLLQDHPEMAQRERAIENHIRQFTQNPVIETDTIGLIFHYLQSPGLPTFITNQILWQVEQLNIHFGLPNVEVEDYYNETLLEYTQRASDPQLMFCLANPLTDPTTGSGSSAIDIVPTTVTQWDSDHDIKFSELGGADAYQPDQFINIWIGDLGDVAGYATSPAAPAEVDGIVMDYRYLGEGFEPYTQSKTMTHLLGNYLGLKDLWNETYWCTDDGVADTPIHNAPNYTVPNSPLNRHVSLCPGVPQEMLFNYMDSTDDEWQKSFTQGQVIRMKAMLADNGPRAGLKEGLTLCDPIPRFHQSTIYEATSSADNKSSLRLYPNPSIHQLNVEFSSQDIGTGYISIFNAMGIEQHQQTIPINQGVQVFDIDINNWTKGFYILQIRWNEQQLSKTFIR